jgi:hypothetical protein
MEPKKPKQPEPRQPSTMWSFLTKSTDEWIWFDWMLLSFINKFNSKDFD